MPPRLLVAYGLIALLVLAALALAWWTAHNSHDRRLARARSRIAARYRLRDGPPTDR